MNQFKNGTLLVVIATTVTAVLILMTGRDISSSLNGDNKHIVEATESSVQEVTELEVAVTNVELEPNLLAETDVVQKTMAIVETTSEKITAPEGPFSKLEGSIDDNDANKNNNITKPAAYIQPTIVVATTMQDEIPEELSQPIWMDQKLGDFKSLDKRDVVFKLMPTSPNGLQGENPEQVVTNKSDKFAPMTVSDKYNYQQMPMYNGGYYIAPMPSYFMPSMLPGNPTIKK